MAHPSWSPHRVPSPPPQRRLWCGLPPSCGCCCLVAMTTHRGFIFNSRRRLEGRRRRSPAALQSGGGMHPGLALAFRPGAGLTPMEGAPLTALLAANSSWAPPECPGEGAQMRPWSWKDPAPKYEAASLLRSYTHCPTQSGDPEGVSSGPSAGEESEAQPDEIQSSREAEGWLRPGPARVLVVRVCLPPRTGQWRPSPKPLKVPPGRTRTGPHLLLNVSKFSLVLSQSSFTLVTLNTWRAGLVAGGCVGLPPREGRGIGRLQGCESMWKGASRPGPSGNRRRRPASPLPRY